MLTHLISVTEGHASTGHKRTESANVSSKSIGNLLTINMSLSTICRSCTQILCYLITYWRTIYQLHLNYTDSPSRDHLNLLSRPDPINFPLCCIPTDFSSSLQGPQSILQPYLPFARWRPSPYSLPWLPSAKLLLSLKMVNFSITIPSAWKNYWFGGTKSALHDRDLSLARNLFLGFS